MCADFQNDKFKNQNICLFTVLERLIALEPWFWDCNSNAQLKSLKNIEVCNLDGVVSIT